MELTKLCKELNNWFDLDRKFGTFTISGGTVQDVLELANNQYYRIVGSIFNDGVHKHPDTELVDEIFDGAIWAMAIPPEVIALCDQITEWEGKYGDAVLSPYASESFGGYSYSRGSKSSQNGDGSLSNYKDVFADELNRWRKV